MPTKQIQPRKKGISLDHLTDRHRNFVSYLLADEEFSPSKAAEKAGFAPPYPQAANRLMRHPNVQKALGKAIYDRQQELRIEANRVLIELAQIGFADPRNICGPNGSVLPLKDMPEEIARTISSYKTRTREVEEGVVETAVEVRFWDKIGALQLIAKHLGMLDERLKVEHELGEGTSDMLRKLLRQAEGRDHIIDAKVIEHKVAK